MIKGDSETKFVRETILDSYGTSYINFNGTINSTADWYRCIPQVSPGITSAQKVGKLVMPTRCTLHLNFHFSSTEANTRDIVVVLYVITSKTQKQYANTGVNSSLTSGFNSFLDPGDGVNDAGYDGKWLGTTYPINHDVFTLQKKKLLIMNRSSGVSNGAGVVGQYDGNGRGQYAPNSKEAHRMSVRIKLPKKLLYDQNANTLPTNHATWFAVGYYYRQGLAPDTGGGVLQVDASTEMSYKDE